MRILTETIDLHDCSLEAAGEYVQEKTNAFLDRVRIQMARPHEQIIGVDIHPLRTQYSLPAEDSYHDYHYSDNGFIVIVKLGEKC